MLVAVADSQLMSRAPTPTYSVVNTFSPGAAGILSRYAWAEDVSCE